MKLCCVCASACRYTSLLSHQTEGRNDIAEGGSSTVNVGYFLLGVFGFSLVDLAIVHIWLWNALWGAQRARTCGRGDRPEAWRIGGGEGEWHVSSHCRPRELSIVYFLSFSKYVFYYFMRRVNILLFHSMLLHAWSAVLNTVMDINTMIWARRRSV